MMRKAVLFSLLAAAFFTASVSADVFDFRGYFKLMPVYWKQPPIYTGSSGWKLNGIIHTRQNLRCYPHRNLTLGLELKTRLFAGEEAGSLMTASDVFQPPGFFHWERDFIDEEEAQMTGVIDRAWLDWYIGEVQFTFGRQRIAWGTSLVWNPIDIFNPSSPLDFDNEEKPGTDALRLQWYTGPASKFEFAIEPHKDNEDATVAFLAQINKWGYDFILMGGALNEDETVLGAAYAGDIAGGGFRGEILIDWRRYLKPGATGPLHRQYFYRHNTVVSLSGDYTFPNSLYLHGALLFNQRGTTGDAGGQKLYQALLDRQLTPARLSLFAQIGGNLHPLVRGDVFGIANPYDGSCYAGPALSWSAAQNLDLTFTAMTFGGKSGTEFGDNAELFFGRLKWVF